MKRLITFSIVVIAILLLAWNSPKQWAASPDDFSAYSHPRAFISLKGETFEALVADTVARKEEGLSGFSGLANHQAMFFPYDTLAVLPFWMKDMLFSIDIVWLDSNMSVVHMEEGVSPDSYPTLFSPGVLSQYVIEFSAGTIDRIGLSVGDQASISI